LNVLSLTFSLTIAYSLIPKRRQNPPQTKKPRAAKIEPKEDLSNVQLKINSKTTIQEVQKILESDRQYMNIQFGFRKISDLTESKKVISLLLKSLAKSLLHVTFSYPDSEVFEMIFNLPNLKSIRIFDLKNYEPLQLTAISKSIESAFIDEGFDRLDVNLLKHMPNLKKLKVQWLYQRSLEKIVKVGSKLDEITYMYKPKNEKIGQFYDDLKESEKCEVNQEIRLMKKVFRDGDEVILLD
jgi:hypothetical protein